MTDREVCKHGHVGWMSQRYQWDARRGRCYWTRRCVECARIWTLECSRRRRAQAKAVVRA